jgi:hypothetical protein
VQHARDLDDQPWPKRWATSNVEADPDAFGLGDFADNGHFDENGAATLADLSASARC